MPRTLFYPLVLLAALAGPLLAQESSESISLADLAAVKADQAQRAQAIESVYGAVVAIFGNDRGGGGSGVLYDPAGYALTNHHVVAAAGTEGWAGLADGRLYRWDLVGTDPGGDVAIIKLRGKKQFPAAPLGDSEKVRVGDWAMAMGNPFVLAEDFRPTVTLGIVSGTGRYQEGSGLNQLVYGNCIQVDSSINPGNSGGPLFSLRGEIIGINGRGSFQERGRVNVGLGYAISSNQIKLFIPELLSTKVAQHGTLDAIFGTREEGVICHTVNLDAPIAKAGLELGDKLISFERFPITDANQFTNIVSMYPALWPAEVTWERGGTQHTAHVRLISLPYEPIVRQPEKPKEQPMPQPQPRPGGPPGMPGAKPVPRLPLPGEKENQKPQPPVVLGNAGTIRDAEVNRTIAEQILAHWQQQCRGEVVGSEGLRIESQLLRGEEVAGKQTLHLAADGRLRADYELDGKSRSVVFDGSGYWIVSSAGVQTIGQARALRDPHFCQAAVIASLLSEKPLSRFGTLALDGSDKARGRLCYRLSVTDANSEQLFLWLSVFGDDGRPQIQLQKSGVGIDDDEPIASVTYDQWQDRGGLRLPMLRKLVLSLAERIELVCVTQQVASEKIDDQVFQIPPQP
ncbi:MAG TPA: trypsin-like peptidase domain-containing protein [Pirellulaceae bacterium]|nr:trypsin-like peptidase domain-containing protein [Pirellulaceae bacterium]